MMGRVKRDNSAIGVGHKAGISISITLSKMMVSKGISVGIGSKSMMGRVKRNNSSIGVGHKAGISITLSKIVVSKGMAVGSISTGGKVGSGGNLVGRVEGDNSAIGVGDQAGVGVAKDTESCYQFDHAELVDFSRLSPS